MSEMDADDERERCAKFWRDGKIAVLYTPAYGAGWSTCNREHEGLIFDREIVEAVLNEMINTAKEIAKRKYSGADLTGFYDLEVAWVPKGERFMIESHDGYEKITIIGPDFGHIA